MADEEFNTAYADGFGHKMISHLRVQIEAALPTLESSAAFKEHDDVAQVVWAAQAALLQANIDKDKAPNEDKNAHKEIVKQRSEELAQVWKETWPDRTDKAEAVFGELDLPAIETAILECSVLVRCEPGRLAGWLAESSEHQEIWKKFWEDKELMKKMVLNGGAALGKFHESAKIHADITQNFANDAPNELHDRIALAVALEFAEPVAVFKKPDQFIDPVERFWHYANAHNYGMLDKNFETLSVWELRNVVNCDATNEDLTWIREMLKRWRPDQVRTPCPKWKYLWSQRTDTANRKKAHEFENYPDLVSAGGACGPQSWYGRALCRAWGLPAWGVRQPGHAAISRWYAGAGCWGTELGYEWEFSHFSELRYYKEKHERRGTDFNEDSRARINGSEEEYYSRVALLEAIADCVGEWLVEYPPADLIWRSLAISLRYKLATNPWMEEPKEWRNKPVKWGRPLLPTTSPTYPYEDKIEMKRGQWVIPAAAISSPSFDKFEVYHEFKDEEFPHFPGVSYRTGKINVMASWTGGTQISFGKGNYWWEYTLPGELIEGDYDLSCKFVTVHRTQAPLRVVVVDPEDGTEREQQGVGITYTRGEWERSDPVLLVSLKPGGKIKCNRGDGSFNVAIKEFYLKPSETVAEE